MSCITQVEYDQYEVFTEHSHNPIVLSQFVTARERERERESFLLRQRWWRWRDSGCRQGRQGPLGLLSACRVDVGLVGFRRQSGSPSGLGGERRGAGGPRWSGGGSLQA